MANETHGHFWVCPTCKKYNLHNYMFCTGCGYSGYYQSPHGCTVECKEIQDKFIDTYAKEHANDRTEPDSDAG